MKKLVLTMVLLMALTVVSFAGPEFVAQRADRAPNITGIFAGAWLDADVFELSMDNYERVGGSYVARAGDFEASMRFYSLWDDDNLYIYFDVIDGDHSYDAWEGMGFVDNNVIQMTINERGAEMNQIYDFIADSNEGYPLVWEHWVHAFNVQDQIEIAGRVTRAGYQIEVAMPWSVLQTEEVYAGKEFDFGFMLIDATETGSRKGFLFPWEGGTGAIGDNNQWGTLTLVD
ncbi:sugar-binding protein [Natronospora cellulosivora (SeqCode)]